MFCWPLDARLLCPGRPTRQFPLLIDPLGSALGALRLHPHRSVGMAGACSQNHSLSYHQRCVHRPCLAPNWLMVERCQIEPRLQLQHPDELRDNYGFMRINIAICLPQPAVYAPKGTGSWCAGGAKSARLQLALLIQFCRDIGAITLLIASIACFSTRQTVILLWLSPSAALWNRRRNQSIRLGPNRQRCRS